MVETNQPVLLKLWIITCGEATPVKSRDKVIFTVGEAVRSTCGNSHDDDEENEEENEEDHFHLSPLKPSYVLIIAIYGLHQGYAGN